MSHCFVQTHSSCTFSNIGLGAGVGPSVGRRLDEALQAHPWGVDGAVTSEEEHVVQPATEGAAEEGSNHGDPEVVVAGAPAYC